MPVAPLIWINGFPGSGKLTVAKVFKQLTSDDTIILDNHQLIDPVEARFPRLHPEYQKERHLYRQAVFKEHVYNKANLSKIVVFTGEFYTSIFPSSMMVEADLYNKTFNQIMNLVVTQQQNIKYVPWNQAGYFCPSISYVT